MKLQQLMLLVLDRGLSMLMALCHQVNIQKVLEAWQGFCEGYSFTRRRVEYKPWQLEQSPARVRSSSYHSIVSPRYMACWIDQTRICCHNHPLLVEFVNHGILFKERSYPVHHMINKIEIYKMKNIGCDNCHARDLFQISDNTFCGSNHPTFQIVFCFPSVHPNFLARMSHLSEIQPIVSDRPWQWIPFSNWRFWCFPHRPMGQCDWIQVNMVNVVSHPWIDNEKSKLHLTVGSNHRISSFEQHVEKTKHSLKDIPSDLTIWDLYFGCSSWFFISSEVIF